MMRTMCNNYGCKLRSTCYNYVGEPQHNQQYKDLHHLSDVPAGWMDDYDMKEDCRNYTEIDENDTVFPVSKMDKIHDKE